MRIFKKVAIVGVGLIGGSIALAMKRKRIAGEIVGVSRHQSTLRAALKLKAIDKGSLDLKIIKGADLVILCAPVETILKQADEIAAVAGKDFIITDVGSTKQEIVRKLGEIFPGFIGSHPLAGSQKRGVLNASGDLFKGSLCILTPIAASDRSALRKIEGLWVALGAKVVLLSPARHDKILSLASHLPHIAAFSLTSAVPAELFRFTSGGFKDTTRIAASDNALWSGVFLTNRDNILRSISIFQKELSAIKSAIARKDKRRLQGILKKARLKRESLE